jgi:arginyl-tRNA synthetase
VVPRHTFGDEKDRVVVRENGASTYFASDIAYLLNKFERGFDHVIYVFGADHHGYQARLKARRAASVSTRPARDHPGAVRRAVRGRREGADVDARRAVRHAAPARAEVGSDAARYFYVMRGHEQHLDFDLDLARKHSTDNPVYYVQYAHARVAALMRQLGEKQLTFNKPGGDARASA